MENTQLTVADLASIKNIIEAASSRGAFKAEEMTQVGSIYDKLATFLANVAAQQKAQAEAQAQAEQSAEVPSEPEPEAQGETNA